MDAQTKLKTAQKSAAEARDKMIDYMLTFSPANDLRVSDVKYIADMAQQLAFDATEPFRNEM